MKTSQFHLVTQREVPADAEIVSHQLMLRTGMIRKLTSGIYTWTPLGLKVLRKVETIVREEMDAAGCLELLMPAVQPAELWRETGRWDQFGAQLLKNHRPGRSRIRVWSDPRRSHHRVCARRNPLVQAAADLLLPDPDQVP